MTFITSYNGLQIDYTVQEYIPATPYRANGDPGDPSEGGECDDWEVSGVEDMDELFDAIEEQLFDHEPKRGWLTRKALQALRWCVEEERWQRLPASQRRRLIEDFRSFASKHWADEIQEHCTEHYWQEVGGPGGEEDYFFGD